MVELKKKKSVSGWICILVAIIGMVMYCFDLIIKFSLFAIIEMPRRFFVWLIDTFPASFFLFLALLGFMIVLFEEIYQDSYEAESDDH